MGGVWCRSVWISPGTCDGIRGLAQAAVRLAENLGAANQILASLAVCYACACDGDWLPLIDVAGDTLELTRERGAMRSTEPVCLALIGAAQLELGNLESGRGVAQEGIAFMRKSKFAFNPHSYAILARAQLTLGEAPADIAS